MITGFLASLLWSGFAFAQTDCARVKTHQDFYRCSLQKHPDFQISELKKSEAEALFQQAGQWKNPEIEFQNIKAGSATTTEASLSVPVSQLWTRGPQLAVGQAEQKLSELEAAETLLKARKSLVLDLYRLRQLQTEIEVVNESIESFEKIRRQFKNRPARGPEQEVTLSLVELASGDYELKKSKLLAENSEILASLHALWGKHFELKSAFLPPPKTTWPVLSKSVHANSTNFQTQRLQLESTRAQALTTLTQRESWPEVKLGPVIEQTTDGSQKTTAYGFNIAMTLPLVSLNGGGRKLAESKAQQARLSSDFAQKKSVLDQETLLQKYSSAVEALKKSTSFEAMKKKHHQVDRHFQQGLISGSLVIEAHRQITEFTESQNQQERLAIESFLEIKTFQGEDIEDIL